MTAADLKAQFEQAERETVALQNEKDAVFAEYKRRLLEARGRQLEAEEAWRRAASEEMQQVNGGL